MDLALTPEQELLRRTARDFMTRRSPPEFVRRMRGDPVGYDAAQWREAEQLGWAQLAHDTEAGGALEMVLLAVEAGRTLWPSPLVDRLVAGRKEIGALLSAAELVGMSEAAIDLALAHVKVRQQFGRPLGAFQAVRHRLVEMSAELDLARILVLRAAWSHDRDDDARLQVSEAKVAACRAAQLCVMGSHQLHGGVGFSAEHPLGLYTVAARRAETAYGDAQSHLDRIAELLGIG